MNDTEMIPGLPNRKNYGNLANLKPQQQYTLLRQLHNARRAGLHTDVRIGSPQLNLFSWAAPKDMPTDTQQKRLFITQPLHVWPYKDFEGQIKSKYGYGTVKKLQQSPIVVLQNTGDKIKFTRADKRNAPIYSMIKTKNGNWLTTMMQQNAAPVIKAYNKQHFKNVSLQEAAKMMEEGATATPKVDGTGALVQLGNNSIDVYGINKDKAGNLIRYTDHIGGLRDSKIPPQLVGTVLRAQLGGQKNGRTIKPNQLSGLLNATLGNAIAAKKLDDVKLKLYALGLVDNKDDYDKARLHTVIKALNHPKITQLPVIKSKDQFMKLLKQMKKGHGQLTNEGFVLQKPWQRPVKAKLTQDADVIIRSIFGSKAKDRAGGFRYSLPQLKKEVGNVGSGFSHQMLRDMLANPQKYINRKARITNRGQYESGAYRAPSFIALRSQGD